MKRPFVRSAKAVLASAIIATASTAIAQETIKLGVITDRIGPAKPWSEPITAGAVYAVKELNAGAACSGRKWNC
jgi:branched-chain amino acid transport system substrate-binding protein